MFIKDQWQPEAMFSDVLQLANNQWQGCNLMAEGETVDSVLAPMDCLFAGFECDSQSSLFGFSHLMKNSVAEGVGRTGTTCVATLKHFKALAKTVVQNSNAGSAQLAAGALVSRWGCYLSFALHQANARNLFKVFGKNSRMHGPDSLLGSAVSRVMA